MASFFIRTQMTDGPFILRAGSVNIVGTDNVGTYGPFTWRAQMVRSYRGHRRWFLYIAGTDGPFIYCGHRRSLRTAGTDGPFKTAGTKRPSQTDAKTQEKALNYESKKCS